MRDGENGRLEGGEQGRLGGRMHGMSGGEDDGLTGGIIGRMEVLGSLLGGWGTRQNIGRRKVSTL